MSLKNRRYKLKEKLAKKIIKEISEKLHIDLEATLGSNVNVEVVEVEFGKFFLFDEKPLVYKIEKSITPTLLAGEILKQIPITVVDMGAIPYLCNGADIMAPGVVRFEGKFAKGDIICIVDVKHRKPLAIGEAMYNFNEIKEIKKGKVIKNLHYVSDKIWNLAKVLT